MIHAIIFKCGVIYDPNNSNQGPQWTLQSLAAQLSSAALLPHNFAYGWRYWSFQYKAKLYYWKIFFLGLPINLS